MVSEDGARTLLTGPQCWRHSRQQGGQITGEPEGHIEAQTEAGSGAGHERPHYPETHSRSWLKQEVNKDARPIGYLSWSHRDGSGRAEEGRRLSLSRTARCCDDSELEEGGCRWHLGVN